MHLFVNADQHLENFVKLSSPKISNNKVLNFDHFHYMHYSVHVHVIFVFHLQVLDRDDEKDETSSEEEQEPEVWEDVSIEDLLCDVENNDPCPEPTPKQTRAQKLTALVQWLVYFILMWQSVCKLSDNGLEWLLQFLFQFLKVLSHLSGCEYLAELVTIIPSSLYLLRKFASFDRDNFVKYAVCSKCSKLYDMKDCTEINHRGQRIVKHCKQKQYPRSATCGAPLAKKVFLSNQREEFYPLKVYCYNSVKEKLQEMLMRDNFPKLCESWRDHQTPEGYLADIVDGQVWKDFQTVDGEPFLSAPRNYMFMLNFDFFQPMKHRNDYSVGVLYLANLNLPRSMRFKWENIIVVGIIPGLDKEPKSMNEFLQPLVTEMNALWKGVYMKSSLCRLPLRFRAALACISCDIPAARKLCGFKNHNSHRGCSKCFKLFPGNVKDSFDFSGFKREEWPKRDIHSHKQHARQLPRAKTKTEHDKLAKQYGLYYSVLLELSYFDCIRFTVIDPMHNLFLGTAKSMFKLWVEQGLLSKKDIQTMEKRIKEFDVGTGLGRLPHKMSANYGCYTASQWKNWTLVYSLFVLDGLLPEEHMRCWQAFVLACKFLTRPVITALELQKADLMLLQFCRKFEELYGKSKVKPNMHLHGHLKECVLDYGPIYNFWCFSFERYNGILSSFKTNNRCIEIQLMRKLLSDHFISSAALPNEFEEYFLPIFSRHLMNSAENIADIVKLGPKLVNAALSSNLLDIDWKMLESEVHLPRFHKVRTLDLDDLSSLLSVYKSMYGEAITGISSLAKTVRRFGSIIIGPEKFGSKHECRSLKSARIIASWTDDEGLISPCAGLRPGKVDCFVQHTSKIGSESRQHVFALVDWYGEDESKDKYGKPVEIWRKAFLPGGPSRFLPVARIFSKFVIASTCTFEDKVVLVPLNRTFS